MTYEISTHTVDPISAAEAGTLPGLFRLRCERSPDREAYRQHEAGAGWRSYTWREVATMVSRWQSALEREALEAGDRVAVLLANSVEWVAFDQAAQRLGLAVVPLYTTDNAENIAYILGDSGARLLLVGDAGQWTSIEPYRDRFAQLARVISIAGAASSGSQGAPRVSVLADWLPEESGPTADRGGDPHALATIVYTSGTTGPPKGVMLSHYNILSNAEAVLARVPGYVEDVFLSFLPLSHAFERTVGYYLPVMCGAAVAFARSIETLPEDLATVRPTILVSVPRIYERAYARLQHQLEERGAPARTLFRWAERIGWKRFEAEQHRGGGPGTVADLMWPVLRHLVADKLLARFGGRLRLAVTGGAPMSPTLAHCFLGLGVPLLQGYGLTEAAPVVTGNQLEDNMPGSVGRALPGIAVRLGKDDELLVRGPNVMLGYWKRPEETATAIDADGWLHTGDRARIVGGHVFITGRIKDIIVMSTGEKVAPADIEMALTEDPLFDQAMVVGEGKPYLAALLVLNDEAWRDLAGELSLSTDDPAALVDLRVTERVEQRIGEILERFARHAAVRRHWLTLEPWTIESGLLTPTLKVKRPIAEARFAAEIRALYSGHAIPA